VATVRERRTWMSSNIWKKPWFRPKKMPRGGRLLWFYLTTGLEGNGAGVFQSDPDVAALKTGPWRQGEWEKSVESLAGHIEFYGGDWVWIVGYIAHNYENGVNGDQWRGIEKIVADAPEELRGNFHDCYACLHGLQRPSDSIIPVKAEYQRTGGTPPPTSGGTTVPGRAVPGRTIPPHSSSRSRSKQPRKLTDEQNAWKDARLEMWSNCLKDYYPKGVSRFSDSGHAVKFFSSLAKAGKHDAAVVDRAIALYFRRRAEWRDEKVAEAKKLGKDPPAVAVPFAGFDRQFDALYELEAASG